MITIPTTRRFVLFLLATTLAGPAGLRAQDAGAADSAYRLKTGDGVRMQVYEEPDLSTEVRITKSGDAAFPLIGSVVLTGLTLDEATKKLRDAYAADYLVDPKVTLAIVDYAREFITVLGAVGKPGEVPLPERGELDLATALAAVGGLLPQADSNRVLVVRADGRSVTYGGEQLRGGGGGNVSLKPGDRVVVSESVFIGKFVTVLGQVRSQGPLAFPLDGKLDLVTAIARAGGYTELANPKKISINRGGNVEVKDGKKLAEQAAEPFWLQPDDIITVGERRF